MSVTVVNKTVYVIVQDGSTIGGTWLSSVTAQAICDSLAGGGTVVAIPVNDAS